MAIDRKKIEEAKRKLEEKSKGEGEYPPEFDTRKKGAIITGLVRRREEVPTPKGASATGRLIEIETEKGSFTVWEKTVLTSELDRQGIQVGDYVAIECLGKVPKKNYYGFNVGRA